MGYFQGHTFQVPQKAPQTWGSFPRTSLDNRHKKSQHFQVAYGLPRTCLDLILVPGEGIEPTRDYSHQILSLARLPVPPSRQVR
jgi:hypothetical protein